MVRPGAGDVKTGLELGRIEDKCQWDWGELADEVTAEEKGKKSEVKLKDYAESVRKNYNTLRGYRRVWQAYKNNPRGLLPYSHYKEVLFVKDPDKRQGWLQWAAEAPLSGASATLSRRKSYF